VYDLDSDDEYMSVSGRWRGFRIAIPFFSRMRYDEDEEEFDYAWRYGLRRLVSPVRRVFGLGSSRRRRRYIIDDEDEDVIEVMSDGDSDKERPTWYRRALRGVALPVRRVLRGRNRLVDSDEDSDREVVVVDEESLEERPNWFHRRWWRRRSLGELEDGELEDGELEDGELEDGELEDD